MHTYEIPRETRFFYFFYFFSFFFAKRATFSKKPREMKKPNQLSRCRRVLLTLTVQIIALDFHKRTEKRNIRRIRRMKIDKFLITRPRENAE